MQQVRLSLLKFYALFDKTITKEGACDKLYLPADVNLAAMLQVVDTPVGKQIVFTNKHGRKVNVMPTADILAAKNTEMLTKLGKGELTTDDQLLYKIGYHLGMTLVNIKLTGQEVPDSKVALIFATCAIIGALVVAGCILHKRRNQAKNPFTLIAD